MKKMFGEFKSFAMKGNLVDLAIGLILGAAFGKIVSSFVSDIVMPPLGLLLGGVDFSTFSIKLKEATATTPEVVIKYGLFINTVVDFLVVALAVFFVIKSINNFKAKEEITPPAPPKPTKQEELLTEIRDLLKK